MRPPADGRRNGGLDVPIEVLTQIIALARAAGVTQTDSSPPPEERTRIDRLKAAVAHLTKDQQAVLLALAWIGRDDFGPGQFDEALSNAFDRREARIGDLLALPRLGDLLEAGALACGADLGRSGHNGSGNSH